MKKPHLLGLFFAFALLVSGFFVHAARAQDDFTSTSQSSYADPRQSEYEEGVRAADNDGSPNIYGYIDKDLPGRFASLNCEIYSCPGIVEVGALQGAGKAMAFLYRPTITMDAYVADLMQDAGIATPAYAQGLGFSALEPVLEVWKVFRNLAYLFYVVIFLIIGFMIMFRQKIGGQAVVSAQQALPGIVISIIAVTFSYAIAAFMIEMMYLLMFFLTAVFAPNLPQIKSLTIDKNVFQIGAELIASRDSGVLGTVHDAVNIMVSKLTGSASGDRNVVGWIAGLTFSVIVGFAMLFATFKLFFELLKSYIAIILAVILAPIALMVGAIPGNKAFGGWVRGLMGNLIVFPTVLMAMIISYLVKENMLASTGAGFVPPYIFNGAGLAPQVIGTIFGIGILIVLPEIVDKVRSAVGGPDPFSWFTQALGKRLKAAQPYGVGLTSAGLGAAAGLAGGSIYGAVDAARAPAGTTASQRAGRFLRGAGVGLGGGAVGLPFATTAVPVLARGVGRAVAQRANELVAIRALRPAQRLIENIGTNRVRNEGQIAQGAAGRPTVAATDQDQGVPAADDGTSVFGN